MKNQLLNSVANSLKAKATPQIPADWAQTDETALDFIKNKPDISGGSGGGVTDVTYSQLISLINASTLKAGSFYRITDFCTKHVIPETVVINTGSIEPLIVMSISASQIHKQAYSALYPQDIIYYDVFDNCCEDGVFNAISKRYENGTPRTGKITYRKDTTRGLETHYDWRSVRFRRWEADAPVWQNGGNYIKKCAVKSPENGHIYICVKDVNNSQITPNLDSNNFSKVIGDFKYVMHTNSADEFADGILLSDYVFTTGNYKDLYTFTIFSNEENSYGFLSETKEGYRDISLDKYSVYPNNGNTAYCSYNNVVFYLRSEQFSVNSKSECFSNHFKEQCYNMTINALQFNGNSFGSNCWKNIIYHGFNGNKIGNSFACNIVSAALSNVIGNSFFGNIVTIGNGSFNENVVAENFVNNIIKGEFSSNKVGTMVSNNTFNDGFSNNIMRNSINGNSFSYTYHCEFCNLFSENVVGFNCSFNYFGAYTRNNIFLQNLRFNRFIVSDGIDYSLATHVYQDYPCEISLNRGMQPKLKYIDFDDTVKVVAANS